jgi:serine/threonine protein kinase
MTDRKPISHRVDDATELDSAIDLLVQLDETEDATDSTAVTDSLAKHTPAGADDLRRAANSLQRLKRIKQQSPYCVVDLAYGYGSSVDDAELPSRIGRFEIKRRLGMGGFGVVFLANDPTIDRDVALKVPRVEALINEETRGRFVRESRTAAMVSHPHVATVFEAGMVGPICYIVSEYCPGGSIADMLSQLPENRLPAKAASQVMATVADAVQAAHDQGVLHRDIKPTNLLLDVTADQVPRFIEDPSELYACVKLVDFGLAKDLTRDEARTRTGMLLGTPAYSAPEQIAETRTLGATTDVYSLGATLYHLITGQPPLQKATDFATLLANQNEEPQLPQSHHLDIPKDLSAICMKCLEKTPERRYATAAELADDLRRFIAGKPVVARNISTLGRWSRSVRRNSVLAICAAITLFSIAFSVQTVRVSQRAIEREKIKQSSLIREIELLNSRRERNPTQLDSDRRD